MDVDALAKKVAKLEAEMAQYREMLAEAHEHWSGRPLRRARTEDPDEPTFGQKVAAGGAETISPELHAQIYAPLNDSPEAVEARRQQHLENERRLREYGTTGEASGDANKPVEVVDDEATKAEIMRARFVELGPDQVRTLLTNGGLPQAWHGPATLWLAEKDGQTVNNGQVDMARGGSPSDASAPGQNQPASEADGPKPGDPAPEAGKALPEPSLAEQPPQTGLDRVDEVAEGAPPVPAAQADASVSTDQGSTAKAV